MHARLKTTLTAGEVCTYGAPVTSQGGMVPYGGGGGGLVLPISIDVTWIATDVTGAGQDHSTFTCEGYSLNASNLTHSAGATSSGTMSALTGFFATATSGIQATDTHLAIKGVALQGCFG
jgi:hypothetical protein